MRLYNLTLTVLFLCFGFSLHAGEFKVSEKMEAYLKETQVEFLDHVLPKLEHYCMDCHDPEEDEEVLFLEQIQTKDILNHRHIWRSVAAQLRNRTMPPKKKKRQPTEQERIELSNWIDTFLNTSALEMPNYAGGLVSRRLNRSEYNNTLRDLLGVDMRYSHTFPIDSSGGEGFDNHARTLYLPPILMEKYLESAQEVLDQVVVTPTQKTVVPRARLKVKAIGKDKHQKHILETTFKAFVKGPIEIIVYAEKDIQVSEWTLKVDGIKAGKFKLAPDKQKMYRKFTLDKGLHALSLETTQANATTSIREVQIISNRLHQNSPDKKFHNALFVANPSGTTSAAEAARENLKNFMEKAFRRPVREDEVETYFALYQRAARRGDPYEECVKLSYKAVLVSPHFLFMIEEPIKTKGIHPIGQYELASRLSYFLWSSMPDEQLLKLAEKGELNSPDILRQQVQRMLKDSKSFSFFESFVGQWLGTTEVGGTHAPDGNTAKKVKYRPELGVDLRFEPIHLFSYIIKHNKSLLDLLDANYVIVNERIANHYKIPNVKGDEFRLVQLNGQPRGGVLGLGGVHMATSLKHRTSPVNRGAWVIETLLGTPVPPPPDNIPELDEKKVKHKKLNLREIYEEHRNNDSCSACHNLIDPIGFGLENFNLIGGWREKDNNSIIDASGIMPTGETFSGPKDLKKILLKEKETFIRHLVRKILGYAVGRQINDYDAGTIERVVKELSNNKYSSQRLIESIVLSTPFRYKQKLEE